MITTVAMIASATDLENPENWTKYSCPALSSTPTLSFTAPELLTTFSNGAVVSLTFQRTLDENLIYKPQVFDAAIRDISILMHVFGARENENIKYAIHMPTNLVYDTPGQEKKKTSAKPDKEDSQHTEFGRDDYFKADIFAAVIPAKEKGMELTNFSTVTDKALDQVRKNMKAGVEAYFKVLDKNSKIISTSKGKIEKINGVDVFRMDYSYKPKTKGAQEIKTELIMCTAPELMTVTRFSYANTPKNPWIKRVDQMIKSIVFSPSQKEE